MVWICVMDSAAGEILSGRLSESERSHRSDETVRASIVPGPGLKSS